jgi:hypothetical protein
MHSTNKPHELQERAERNLHFKQGLANKIGQFLVNSESRVIPWLRITKYKLNLGLLTTKNFILRVRRLHAPNNEKKQAQLPYIC